MAPTSKKRFNINLLIPFMVIALLFGFTIWQKYRASREIPPAPQVQKPVGNWTAVLFFVTDDNRLAREARELEVCDDPGTCLKDVLEELVNGPVGEFEEALPDGTVINSVWMEKERAIIDLNKAFADSLISGSSAEMLAVFSIVNTAVTNFPQIAGVKINIDGDAKATLRHVDLTEALLPDYTLESHPPPPPAEKKAAPRTSKTIKGKP